MPAFRLIATDLVSGVVRGAVPWESAQFSHVRNGAGQMKLTLPKRLPPEWPITDAYDDGYSDTYGLPVLAPARISQQVIDASRTLMLLERDGQIVGDGIVWGPQPSGSGQLEITGASLWSWFNRRMIVEDRLYGQVDQTLIARDLVDWCQGRGDPTWGTAGDAIADLGIVTAGADSGVDVDGLYYGHEGNYVGSTIEQAAAAEDGYDFSLDVTWNTDRDGFDRTFRTWYPRRSRRTGIVLTWGVNIVDYTLSVAGGQQANRIHGVGQGQGAAMLRTTQTDATTLGTYPLLEDQASFKKARDHDQLVGLTRGRLAARRLPPTRLSVQVKTGPQLRVGSWVLGDEARTRIDDGWTQIDGIYRIEGWTITVNKQSQETVTIELVDTEAVA